MPSLTGPQREMLRKAVQAAFPKGAGLEIWLGEKFRTRQCPDNILAEVNLGQPDNKVAFDLVGWFEAKGRTVEFLAKLALVSSNEPVREALVEILGCSGNQDDARRLFPEFLGYL